MLPPNSKISCMKPNQTNATLTAVLLENLSIDKRAILSSLKVQASQEDFGGTFDASVKEWERADRKLVLGITFVKGDDPVGIVLLKRPTASPDWAPEDAVSLHGLKIAESYQGQGLGRVSFRLSIEAATTRWPMAKRLVLAVDAENAPALTVYRSFGMSDSGPIFKGRIGLEHRLMLDLAGGGSRENSLANAESK